MDNTLADTYNLHHTHRHTYTHHSKSNDVIYRKRWREYFNRRVFETVLKVLTNLTAFRSFAIACEANMAATLRTLRTEYYWWRSDWLKLLW